MPDDRRRDHVADILRDIAGEALERDADDLSLLHDRPAGVAGIDRGIDLDREVRVDDRMRVRAEIDARNDAARDRKPVAADRVAEDGDARLDLGNAAERERLGVLEKRRRVLHPDHREVAIVRHVLDDADVLLGIVLLFQREKARIADDVGVGHHALLVDHPAGARAAAGLARQPRGAVVRLLRRIGNAAEALANDALLRPRGESKEEENENGPQATAHHGREHEAGRRDCKRECNAAPRRREGGSTKNTKGTKR